jgi:hypothetical protein
MGVRRPLLPSVEEPFVIGFKQRLRIAVTWTRSRQTEN